MLKRVQHDNMDGVSSLSSRTCFGISVLNLGFEAHPEGGVLYFEFEIWLLEIHAMDLSIIIVTYNSSAYIEACLRSILEQMREVGP